MAPPKRLHGIRQARQSGSVRIDGRGCVLAGAVGWHALSESEGRGFPAGETTPFALAQGVPPGN
jgi:hypothetical protein